MLTLNKFIMKFFLVRSFYFTYLYQRFITLFYIKVCTLMKTKTSSNDIQCSPEIVGMKLLWKRTSKPRHTSDFHFKSNKNLLKRGMEVGHTSSMFFDKASQKTCQSFASFQLIEIAWKQYTERIFPCHSSKLLRKKSFKVNTIFPPWKLH